MQIHSLMQTGFAQNSRLISGICEDVTKEEAFFRPYELVNHLSWEVGHLAFVRNTLIKLLEPTEKLIKFDNEIQLFTPNTPLLQDELFPSLPILNTVFAERGEKVIDLLGKVSEEHLKKESPFKLSAGKTIGEQLWTFFLHESVHYGEMFYLKNIIKRQRVS
ncbi:DinB superfamily protein [Pseudarcicella hirudinis]|uniref:DinB superfamily protein n=1 Tax=Pseudarcicella hirudinis TaxID=1079859 RepID=A0A1I5NTS3_9BACT|nr:DinB family protein [Pseudarcicella hirudinis]SFP25107.1 DinB superfamily protein [Pseudarcicella hirudinis]